MLIFLNSYFKCNYIARVRVVIKLLFILKKLKIDLSRAIWHALLNNIGEM